MELTNENKIRLQFEKAQSEIEYTESKTKLFNALTVLTNVFTFLLVFVIIGTFIILTASLAGCAEIISYF